MKAVGYVRVSTEKQADFGVSLDAQTEKVRAMATVQGVELTEIIVDAGESRENAQTFRNDEAIESCGLRRCQRRHRGQARPAYEVREGLG